MNVAAMPAWLYAALRGGVQMAWSAILALPALAGVRELLPTEAPEMVVVIVLGVVSGIVGGGFVGLVRWLESRTGDGLGARIARLVGRVLMLALSRFQPTYAAASSHTTPVGVVVTDAGTGSGRVMVTALRE